MAAPSATMLARPHGLSRIVFIGAGALTLLLVSVIGGLAGGLTTTGSSSSSQSLSSASPPSPVAIADIPADYLALYQQAAARFGVDWTVLAAIGKIECDQGRSQAPGCNPPGTVNDAGATGPMQFLGSTWRTGTPPMSVPAVGPPTSSTADGYATDGDGDGLADVWNPADAIFAAARLLAANGAPDDYGQALLAYNGAQWYVDAVLSQAAVYRDEFAPGASGGVQAALSWAVAHVGQFAYNLGPPTDRGGSVEDMQSREPVGTTCDCSMYVRWAMAQAGLDVGLTTSTQWTANGLLADDDTTAQMPVVSRGVGPDLPPGGYQPGDIIFFGHDAGPTGHDALWLGNGQIVQCSSSGDGSNIRPLAGYVAPTGWIRWGFPARG
jgi:peptidoglycan DL-endopeptidase CwlO